jgi:hypothetical protein
MLHRLRSSLVQLYCSTSSVLVVRLYSWYILSLTSFLENGTSLLKNFILNNFLTIGAVLWAMRTVAGLVCRTLCRDNSVHQYLCPPVSLILVDKLVLWYYTIVGGNYSAVAATICNNYVLDLPCRLNCTMIYIVVDGDYSAVAATVL